MQNEAIIAGAGVIVFAAINKVLKEELRDHPAIYRRILARLIGLEGPPGASTKTKRRRK